MSPFTMEQVISTSCIRTKTSRVLPGLQFPSLNNLKPRHRGKPYQQHAQRAIPVESSKSWIYPQCMCFLARSDIEKFPLTCSIAKVCRCFEWLFLFSLVRSCEITEHKSKCLCMNQTWDARKYYRMTQIGGNYLSLSCHISPNLSNFIPITKPSFFSH